MVMMPPKLLGLPFALLASQLSLGQSGCSDSVQIQFSSLEDFVELDSSITEGVLKPMRPIRRKEQPDFEYGKPANPSHQTLQFMDGFEDTVKVYLNDSLIFAEIVVSNPVFGAAGVYVDLGVRATAVPKQLKVEYRDRCLNDALDRAYPIVMIWTDRSSWILRFQDYWSILE